MSASTLPKLTARTVRNACKLLKSPPTIRVVACPFSGGQPRPGTDIAPSTLLSAGLIPQLEALHWKVNFQKPLPESFLALNPKDDPPIGRMQNPRSVSKVCKEVSKQVSEACKAGELPLTLGGDHSLAMGTIAGTMSKYPNACVVWVDAHADINTPNSTESGNLHGCPVSFLLGLKGAKDLAPFSEWLSPCLDAKSIVYIGLRDVDPAEKAILRENNIKAFSMHDVDKHGIGKVVEMALEAVNPNGDRPIHLTYDVDALDPAVAPSTGTPVRGGLSFREGHYIVEAIAETGMLVALDIMEVNPSLRDELSVQQTVAVGCSLARSALGETLL
ncbi:arginase [Phaffia rhodozyma]|uniref:Arginase n=1 Tax=Phaffia rhodozyma TaxID=264483 RepID=A0A0F7SQM5_PHARH|nr:arginase [Phaffia rhodozyma]